MPHPLLDYTSCVSTLRDPGLNCASSSCGHPPSYRKDLRGGEFAVFPSELNLLSYSLLKYLLDNLSVTDIKLHSSLVSMK